MKVEKLLEIIGSDFYTGVPDSQLKALCDYLMNTYGIDRLRQAITSPRARFPSFICKTAARAI